MADLSPGVTTSEQITERLAVLRRKLAARTDRNGDALLNFKANVADLRGEIARLEGLSNA